MAATELQIGDVVKFRCYGKVVKGTITDFSPSLFDGPALICVKVKRERERSQSVRKV
jgi:hypothetical protein